MKDKYVKKIIAQYAIPFSILLIAVVVMLIDFSNDGKQKEAKEVADSLIDITDDYGQNFHNELEKITEAAITVADIAEKYSTGDKDKIQDMLYVLFKNTESYMAVICDVSGKGMDQYGNDVNIGGADYFSKFTTGKQQYLYTDDDGVMNEKSFITEIPLYVGNIARGHLLVYYPVSSAAELVKSKEFDTAGYYAVIDLSGNVMMATGRENTLYQETDFWENLLKNCTNSKETQKNISALQTKIAGTMEIDGKEEVQHLFYSPTGMEDWFWVIGLRDSYVKGLQEREWEGSRLFIVRLVIAIIIFLCMLIIISIFSKIRQDQKSKDLEDKADTDLLTGLNNKLATERKIKEYLKMNPSEQSILFVMDIDNFKKINDTMGHAFGDEVLRTLGIQIRSEFRVSDIVGRTGGDEFMIFLKNVKDDTMIEREGQKVERFFKNFQAGEYVKYSATASIGGAIYPQDATDFEGLYKAADTALYRAKKRGKNQLAYYQDCTK